MVAFDRGLNNASLVTSGRRAHKTRKTFVLHRNGTQIETDTMQYTVHEAHQPIEYKSRLDE